MRFLKFITFTLIAFIAISTITTAILLHQYSRKRGDIEGTGLIIQEINDAGGVHYDVDDNENIYFAADPMIGIKGIAVYNHKGEYLYTLPISTNGAISVKIDEENNILVYDVRRRLVTQYNSKGNEINSIYDDDYSLQSQFPWNGNQNIRERNGVDYINNNGTITKIEDGEEMVVFTVPSWQQWCRASQTIMVLSIVTLFLRIFFSKWIKSYKERYGYSPNTKISQH